MSDKEKPAPDESGQKPGSPVDPQGAPKEVEAPPPIVVRDVTGNTGRCFMIIGVNRPTRH
jgi:hypothetical protein